MDAMKMAHRAVQQPGLQMNTRRSLIIAATVSALAKWTYVCAQAPAQATETSLREAMRKYVVAWNRHDVQAWSSFLTEDIWYTKTTDFYERLKEKKASSCSSRMW